MTADRRAVTVIGSVHMDLIAVADRLPARGESLTGHLFGMHPGGKGGNQAAQVALNDVPTFIVSRLGDDLFGRELRARLAAKGVDTSFVVTDTTTATGASPLLVGGDGEYASIIVPGASALLSKADVDAARPMIARSAAVMLQLEIPSNVTAYAARTARDLGAQVVFNPSPAPSSAAVLPDDLWECVDVLVVNELEAARIGGTDLETRRTGAEGAEALRTRFSIPVVVKTMGAEGAVAVGPNGVIEAPAWPVNVVDTVGAGDAFVGTLVSELVRGLPLVDALHHATAAGALAVTRSGAFDALPSRPELLTFIRTRSHPTSNP
ncbi:MAG: ribokinase [Thermomicrobiales bacterium]|nr:ribokinase [Thermomicrobiales bacterium]